MGFEVSVEVIQDSTAAKGMASRAGVGKVKHLDIGWLWIQEIVKIRAIILKKIDGKYNPADFLTKPKSVKEMSRLSEALNYDMPSRADIFEEGEAAGIEEVAKWMREVLKKRTATSNRRMKFE